MTTRAKPLGLHRFGPEDPLGKLQQTTQISYLRCYLGDLQAAVVIEEPNYFDRDYLAEFSAFYSLASQGYPNVCRRLHFFSDAGINRKTIRAAAGGNIRSSRRLQECYLGFVILRPIPAAPLGRTVLRWYPERFPDTPRVVEPSRPYVAHLAGITLEVQGVAWQQQDSAVGACATVGLWSMLHSSAFDDHHAIPTTADITRSAHRRASLGARIFPSNGLNIFQVCEAIKEQDLSPIIIESDIVADGSPVAISKERFASSCAAFIRSGYPVLLIGRLGSSDLHAICAVGFRSCAQSATPPLSVNLEDAATDYLYIHDDNLGPNVRFRIHEQCIRASNGALLMDKNGDPVTGVYLQPESPSPHPSCPTQGYPEFQPQQMVVAVHNNLRTSPDTLHDKGMQQAQAIGYLLQTLLGRSGARNTGVSLSTRFIRLADYLGDELSRVLGNNSTALSNARLALCERVSPMSLHIGVVRIGMAGAPLADILYDTTDSDRNHPVYAHVAYREVIATITECLINAGFGDLGLLVKAW